MPRAGLTRDRVVRAAADLADEVGLEQVTLAALARQFGVRLASLYSHVHGAEDLRTSLALLALEEMAERTAEAVAGRAGRDALSGLAGSYRGYAREHPGRYAAAQLHLDPEAARAGAGPRHAQLSRAVLRGYRLSPTDETHAVRLVGSLVTGFVALEGSGSFDHSDPAPDATWERALDALDALLRHWPDPTTDPSTDPFPDPSSEEDPR